MSFRKSRLATVLRVFFGLLLGGGIAQASQEGMIVVDSAPVRVAPSLDAQEMERLSAGTKVRISNTTKDGWYKYRRANGKDAVESNRYGWIWHADVVLSEVRDTNANMHFEAKGHERRKNFVPTFFVRGVGSIYMLYSGDVSQRLGLGAGHVYLGGGGAVDLSFRLEDSLRLAFRVGTYSSGGSIAYRAAPTADAVTYDVTLKGIPILVGLEADVSQHDDWEVSSSFYLGAGINSLIVTAPELRTPNQLELSQTFWAGLINFSGKYWLNRRFAFVLEAGAYFSRIQKTVLSNGFNGDGPFRDTSGALSTISANHIAPVFSVGAQLAF